MVHLSRIYTRAGDTGQTRLADNSPVPKTDLRVQAYGDVDEANAAIGLAMAGELPGEVSDVLGQIQHELFDVGADLSTPLVTDPPWPPLRIDADAVARLESWCDRFNENLPPLNSFVLPSGTLTVSHLHLARTITRRAERTGWQAVVQYGTEPGAQAESNGGVNTTALTYLNRLSDLLFIVARYVATNDGAHPESEVLWRPGERR